uniref:deoxyribose-phosphate aldolase n=1 Tax=Clastoptera arizonana TaxID=38151 RepID=A0A1B6C0V0_9HEMI
MIKPEKSNKNHINKICLIGAQNRLNDLKEITVLSNKHRVAWLLKAITLIDLSTLSGDDCTSNVTRLCIKAFNPLPKKFIELCKIETNFFKELHVAAVCVYPARVGDAKSVLKKIDDKSHVALASVLFSCYWFSKWSISAINQSG